MPKLDGIDHIHVYVTDRVAAEAWYASTLGLRRVAHLAFWAAGGGPLTLENGDGSVHIALFERPALPCRSTIALRVDAKSFVQWRTHLRSVLADSIEAVDHDVSWSLYFDDPDHNPFEITCYDYEALRSMLV